jgi:hypothetical protein
MEPNNDKPPIVHHPWWKRILFGAAAGAFYGVLNIWFYEVSLVRLVAAIISGASFFVVLGLLVPKFSKDRSKFIALAGFSGIVAGIVYWVVARPSSSLILAMMIGFGGGLVCAWAETRG